MNNSFFKRIALIVSWLVFLVIFFLPSVQAAELYFLPAANKYFADQSFLVAVKLDSKEPINAIDISINWPFGLTLNNVQTGGSIFDLWVSGQEPQKGNTLRLQAGSTTGWQGDNGQVVDLLFTADQPGNYLLNFNVGAIVVLADGKATPAAVKLLSGQYEVVDRPDWLPVLTSDREPEEDKWYQNSIFDVHWPKRSGYEYSYLLTQDATLSPDHNPESEPLYDLKYEQLTDGIYYFSLLTRPVGGDWSPRILRRAMLDTTPPQDFKIIIDDSQVSSNNKVKLVFNAVDASSGVDRYEILKNGDWLAVSSPYEVKVDYHSQEIAMRVLDRAGNFTMSKIEVPGRFNLTSFSWNIFWLILVLLIILLVWLIYKKIIFASKNDGSRK